MAVYSILDFGAKGDGNFNNAQAIQSAIDTCHQNGGGTVVIPSPHIFLSGSIVLKSLVELHLERGATLLASPNSEDYTHTAFPPERTHPESQKKVFIYALNCKNLAIAGSGVIDGDAHKFMTEELDYIYRGNPWRPALICFVGCTQVNFNTVTLRNAANWALHLSGCEDVHIEGIRILNDLKVPNCDGIDPDHCRNVRIANCHIEAGDDCIVLKNHPLYDMYGPTENITVTGCTLISTSSAIKIGTESVDDFRNIVIDSCTIQNSNRALSIQLRDKGNVERVRFSNCSIETRRFYPGWWGTAEAIYITAIPRNAETKVGKISDISFHHITCKGENGVFVYAEDPDRIEEIVFDQVRVELTKTSKWEGGHYDLRPCEGEPKLSKASPGFYLQNANDVSLVNCRVRWNQTMEGHIAPALEAHGVRKLKLQGFDGIASAPGKINDQLID